MGPIPRLRVFAPSCDLQREKRAPFRDEGARFEGDGGGGSRIDVNVSVSNQYGRDPDPPTTGPGIPPKSIVLSVQVGSFGSQPPHEASVHPGPSPPEPPVVPLPPP